MADDRDDSQPRSSGASGGAPDRADLWRDAHLPVEVLSEYLDEPEAFSSADQAAIDQHLAGCTECGATFADLRTLVSALAALPEPVPSRSFALTPELLGERDLPLPLEVERKPIDIQRTSAWRRRQIAAVRYATATAAVLFVLVLGADLISNAGGGTVGDDDDSAPAPMQSYATDTQEDSDAQRNAATEASGGEANAPQPTTASAAPTATTAAASAAEPTTGVAALEPTAAAAEGEQIESPPVEDSSTLAAQVTEETIPANEELTALSEKDGTDEQQSSSSGRSGWRTLELGLALLLAWLLAALVILPRLGTQATPDDR